MVRRVAVAWALTLTVAASANAQSGSSGTSTGQNTAAQSSSTATTDTRPATTTFYGDTGLWYVPTAEVLAHGKWSVSGYRRGTNFIQGYTNVADFAGNFAVGLGDRASVRVVPRDMGLDPAGPSSRRRSTRPAASSGVSASIGTRSSISTGRATTWAICMSARR